MRSIIYTLVFADFKNMTNVQFSTSTLDRLVARRTFPLHARTGVCRNLFGPVDHDELNREMQSKLREISERDQRRWNFNFEKDQPLLGDYEWEENLAETSPSFYRESVQLGRSRVVATVRPSMDSRLQEDIAQGAPVNCEDRLASTEGSAPCSSEINQENRADTLNSGKMSRKVTPCGRRKRSTTTDLNATQITDFFAKKRRAMGGKPGEVACQSSSTPLPIEQTPRKRIR